MSGDAPDYFASEDSGIDIAVAKALSERVTAKALGDPAAPRTPDGVARDVIGEMLFLAGNAPFHYPAHPLVRGEGAKEPWRAYLFDGQNCRALLRAFDAEDQPGKLANMLAAAEALFCVTWMPDPPEEARANGAYAVGFSDRNIEHVAATAAFIQSLLVAATSAGWPNYWSSGGVLRSRKYLERMGAGETEQLLGAVFLFPRDLSGLDVKPGSMRSERGAPADWAQWVEI